MSGLTDDCFAAGDAMLTVAEALARIGDRLGPMVGIEEAPLVGARGRILAEDVTAPRDVPPHDNSAVDGFAFRFDDLAAAGETRLTVAFRLAAGQVADRSLAPGTAARIFTGAPMPAGADTVAMQEDCRQEDETVVIPAGLKRGANRRKAGEDVKAGRIIIPRGRRLRAQELGLVASVGRVRLRLYKRLNAAVFSTGDEIRDPGQPAGPGAVYDANRFAVMALLEGLGCHVTDLGILPDRLPAIRDALARAAASGHHVLVTSGGVSLGEEDHVKAAVEALGRLDFWKLAIKPGRPIALGRVGSAAFIGLPGNPVAAMVTFVRIARPVLLRLMGAAEAGPAVFRVPAAFDYRKKAGRREWLRARLVHGADGAPAAEKFAADGSGILTSMVWADGLVELDEARGDVKTGETVDFLPFGEVLN
jgi:molybdopterin molybdotransferase